MEVFNLKLLVALLLPFYFNLVRIPTYLGGLNSKKKWVRLDDVRSP